MTLMLLFLLEIWLGTLNLKNKENLKIYINGKLMLIEWHPKRWWNFCISEDEKKEIEPIFTEGL